MKGIINMKNLRLGMSIISYNLYKLIGYPKTNPVFLTFSVNDWCNCKCKMCNIWKNDSEEEVKKELTLDEIKEIFSKFGDIYWITITGGEPFLKKNLVDIVKIIYEMSSPEFMTIATNGMNRKKIVNDVEEILKFCPRMKLIINVSIDGKEPLHDSIRGVKGCYRLATKTIENLKSIKNENLTVGINTVVSKYNSNSFEEIYNHIKNNINPDSYIIELAENRAKLYNDELEIYPKDADMRRIVNFLIEKINEKDYRNGIIPTFRKEYYNSLLNGNFPENFEGVASGYIMSKGDVWLSYSKPMIAGNLRDNDYDFRKIWFNEKSKKLREKMKTNYSTIMSNPFYVNYICTMRNIPKFILSFFL